MDININGVDLRVWRNGDIFRYMKKYKVWRELPNTANCSGYNRLQFGGRGKKFFRHRIVAYCYLGLELYDTEKVIDHIDRNTINNDVENLRVVSQQQNTFNRNAKGYSWKPKLKKYQAMIMYNNKHYCLGCYDTEEEAHNAYLEGKNQFHSI